MFDMTLTNRLRGCVAIRWLCCTPLFLLLSFFAHGQLSGLTEKVSIKLRNTTALKILQELDRQSSYDFSYTQTQLEKITIVSFNHDNIALGKALDLLSAQAGLVCQVSGKIIAVRVTTIVPAQPVTTGGKPGKITGVIRNDKNETMPGVSITVQGVEKGITSSVSGDYTVALAPGIYTLLVSFIGYQSRQITEVVVKEGEVTDLSVTLSQSDARQLDAVVVSGSARRESTRSLLMTQKNNASMTNGISAEQIRVTPDNNTGQVLKRVSGITVQNDKFVTIRGVSDRYNNVLINGASLPSTEPNRRNFSFDIVPSQLVDNIVVNKTASPDLPGEFTGGLVQINTKEVPTENFLAVTVGTGFNTASVNKQLVSYKRDDKAWMGKVDDNRKYFGDGRLFDPVQYIKYLAENDTATMRKIGAQVPNRWQYYKYPYQPSKNYQLTGGINKRFAKSSVGFVAALTYLNEQFVEEGQAAITSQYNFDSERYRYNTTIGGLFNAAFKTANHRLAWKNLYNKRYSNQLDWRTGDYFAQGYIARRTGEVTLDNRMIHSRLEGEHKITAGGIKFDWSGDYIQLKRDQPDTRFITGQDYGIAGEPIYTYDFSDFLLLKGGVFNSLLVEKRKNAGANLSIPLMVGGEKQLLKMGYSWSDRNADFDAANLRIQGDNETGYTESMGLVPYHKIVTQEAFRKGYIWYRPTSTRSGSLGDRYAGTQQLQAAYAMLDIKPFKNLRVTGGMRYEHNKMSLTTIFYDYLTGNPQLDDSTYLEKDWLPSVNIIYSITEQLNIRAAYSKTLARPDFVERSPYMYYDFTELAEVFGQKGLQVSRIKNYDLRLEFYPSGDEILSASIFYKDFSNPVERFYHIQTTSNMVEYSNLYKATAKGFEIDIRKSMGFISPGSIWLKRLFVSANYTHLDGSIEDRVFEKSPITQKDTSYVVSADRPIQGLSPYIINWGINYQEKLWGFNIGFNRIGRRIVNGGTINELIQWENSRSVLDLQFNLRLMQQKLEIKTNLGDLLNQPFIIYSNTNTKDGVTTSPGPNNDPKGDAFNEKLDLINYKVKRGSNFSISATYRF
jgi:outer membrane receptor protein involved in Fe transport